MDDYDSDKILSESNNEIYVIMRNSSMTIKITCDKIYIVNKTKSKEGNIKVLVDHRPLDNGVCNSNYAESDKNETSCESKSFNISFSDYNIYSPNNFDVVCRIEEDSNRSFSIKLNKICRF